MSVASNYLVKRWLGADQPGFAAHVGFYPVCQSLEQYFDESGVTGAPILIITGELDYWGDGKSCPKFVRWLNGFNTSAVSLTIYPNVHHGFDRVGS